MIPKELHNRFREALFAGKYNLLLGAGISRDALTRGGDKVQGAEDLRQALCKLKGLHGASTLARATSYLDSREIDTYLTRPFSGCKAGPTAMAITRFVWSQLFTLNIDDVIEDAYAFSSDRRQNAFAVNYTLPYESFKSRAELPVVHLHGFVREPNSRYVFSIREYASVTRGLNPWMHLLSDLLRTEPFIISGTSLTEPDLEYYLAARSQGAFSRQAEVSLLVEPHPDAGTEEDCLRLGLILVKAGLAEFLAWAEKQFGPAPTVSGIVVPSQKLKFKNRPELYTEITFFSDFELVLPRVTSDAEGLTPSGFHFGRPPSWEDLELKRDVILKEQLQYLDRIKAWLNKPVRPQIIAGFAPPGAGKTTTLKRVALELAESTSPVFMLKTREGPDIEAAADFLREIVGPVVLFVDNFAERADNVQALFEKLGPDFPILVIGGERDYRREHVETVLSEEAIDVFRFGHWTREERLRLIENYRTLGLIGERRAVDRPYEFVAEVANDTVAEAICRILNDFRPLRSIVESLWNDAKNPVAREAYLVVALAHFCQPQGVRDRIVASAVPGIPLADMTNDVFSLPLTSSPDASDFVIPLNATIAIQLLDLISRERRGLLLKTFVDLAISLAPYVTRRTIVQQTSEARLAGRLFDADKVVRPLLGELADDFYEGCRNTWQWNSRYWEQRALAIADRDLRLAIQHARHAVAIEKHPFPMTTLANLLLTDAERQPRDSSRLFEEAFGLLQQAIQFEANSGRRRTKHAFWVLLRGAKSYLEGGFTLGRRKADFLQRTCSDVLSLFPRSEDLTALVSEVRDLLARKIIDPEGADS